MRGSVYRRGGTWSVQIDRGRDAEGNRLRDWYSGFHTKKEAEQKRTELLSQLDAGTLVSPSHQDLGSFLREWLVSVESRLRHSTWASYRDLIETHIAPQLGHLQLQALTPNQINGFYSQLLRTGRADGRGGLAPKTVRNAHVVLRKALEDAVRWNMLARNPAALADPPRIQDGAPAMQTWTAEEARGFLNSVQGDRLEAAWFLAITTGMRRGEILGLAWTSVDLDASRLSVTQSLITTEYKVSLSPPKSARGRRAIVLDPATVSVLKAHRSRQIQEKLAWGPGYVDSGLVFTRENGELIHPDSFTALFDKLVRRSQLPHIRLHDVRHTYATLALQAGVPVKAVADRLGHASAAFTMNVYVDTNPAMQKDSAEKVAALILGL